VSWTHGHVSAVGFHPPHQEASAITSWTAHLVLWLVAGAGLAADLWSKAWAFSALDPREHRPVWPGVLEFRRSLNAGAIFGVGAGWVWVFVVASFAALAFVLFLFHGSTPRQRSLHVALGLILAGALGNLHDRIFIRADVVAAVAPSGEPYHDIGLIIDERDDGAIRLGSYPEKAEPRVFARSYLTAPPRRQGVVRDFIKFVPVVPRWVPLVGGRDAWPWVFNVADAMLVVGVGLLLIHFWSAREAPHPAALADRVDTESPAADRDETHLVPSPSEEEAAVCAGRAVESAEV